MNEHDIQNAIRDALKYQTGEFWRINVGAGYLSHSWNDKPRWFSTGVPKGFPDLIGIIPRRITDSDVGKVIGQFAFIEVKAKFGRLSHEQRDFHFLLLENGAIGGIARSVDDALNLFKETKHDQTF